MVGWLALLWAWRGTRSFPVGRRHSERGRLLTALPNATVTGHRSRRLCKATVISAAAATAATMAQYKGAASEAGRAMHLMKKREKQREQMEQMKQRITEVRAGQGHHRACVLRTAPAPRGPSRPREGGRPMTADLQQGLEASWRLSVCSSVKWAQKAEPI